MLVAVVFIVLRGNEDSWICANGAWTRHGNPAASMPTSTCPGAQSVTVRDPRNTSYVVDGKPVAIVDGIAEEELAPGSASKLVTKVWTVSTPGDLTGNGTGDVAVVLTQDGGGSGTFYYLAAAMKTADSYQGTNALLIGDRIAPQNVSIESGQIVENYADRAPGESFSASPSVGKTMYAFVDNGKLVEGGSLSRQNLITVATPAPNTQVRSPLTVSGTARGTWYFEASFAVILEDAGGTPLAQVPATAQGEWMTENFVPFTATVSFAPQPAGTVGRLILKKDNPSGLPANDNQLVLPVRF